MNSSFKNSLIGTISFVGLFYSSLAYAVACPMCTVAVVTGTVFARQFGIDDTITGLWIGAITLIACEWTIIWIENFLKKKGKKLKSAARTVLQLSTYILFYALVIFPLHSLEVVGIENNLIFGIDKILFGIISGSLVFFFAEKWHEELKANNNNKVFFPFQRVIIPVGSLVVLSIIFYFLTKT
ncbi:hypothetical protein M0R01_02235 [bacterium]|nr:hypothetical protein [bacterium]